MTGRVIDWRTGLSVDDQRRIHELIDAATRADGVAPVGDQVLRELSHDRTRHLLAVDGADMVGYLNLTPADEQASAMAELVVHRRMRPLLQQFIERNLIPAESLEKFEAAVASAFRLRNSVLAEVLLIAIVYGVGILFVWRHYVALDTSTWYATPSPTGPGPVPTDV